MLEQRTGVYNNPYKFNAKELDKETGLYYYGARYYNPRASIWYGVDPLAVYNPVMEDQFYGDGEHNGGVFNQGNLNPYIYCYQNPIVYVDPNGKQTFFLNTRSFAPFNRFGGGFEGDGDNRKFSTASNSSYRIAGSATINLDRFSMSTKAGNTHSDWLGTKFSSATSPTNVESSSADNGRKTQNYYMHISGSNKALLWGIASPDIDANVNMEVSNIRKGQSFDISGNVYGDKFPSNETYITDAKGNSLFLGVSGADGSPFTSLAGDNDRPMSSFKFKVLLNKDDTFKGVNYRGKNYSRTQWNGQFEKLNPQNGNVQSGKSAK
ncbi:RHS repeat-associated core domain-containing protein [Chryseobacterium sp. MEBOG06]|nr:RHS repeat-associated core domain-containing protein [Chryseobacterium sp. MEBOG06]